MSDATASGGEGVRFHCADGVARVTLDRPGRLNAVDSTTDAALNEIWDTVACDPSIRCVVLSGTGRAFCAGADLKEMAERVTGEGQAFRGGQPQMDGMVYSRSPKPFIAAVNGLAIGGGMETSLDSTSASARPRRTSACSR
jgi:enoyl-CoA hydratase/carnithine racemase